MKKQIMFEYGLNYRLESLQDEIINAERHPNEGFEEAVKKDKELIMEAVYQRDKYIKELEKQIEILKAGITPVLNLYSITNPLIERGNGKVFAVAKTGEEAIERVREYYEETYQEAAEEGFFEHLRYEALLKNIHVDQVHVSPLFYF